jgi:flagellar basal body rod protein FlgF
MRKILSILTALVLALAIATSASAQSSVDGYEDQAGQIQSQIQDGGDAGSTTPVATTTTTTDSADGSLPFTGLDVALLVGAGGLLVVAGLGMRRLTRAPGSA